MPPPVAAFSGEGSGTENDPYQIVDVYQLQEMKDNLNAHYILMNDIDASETINWDTGAGFEPIGDHITPFTGTFQGNGYVIKNLYINRPEAKGVGLFGRVAPDAVVENVGLESVNITGWDWTGGLVGVNKGTVSNSYTTGSISGLGFITGGLVAANTPGGIVSKSYSTASVSGVSMIGGLVGYNRGTITYSYSRGSVAGGSTAGGLVGFNLFEGIISDSYSRASVSGKYNIGGLVGYIAFEAIVSNSYSTGQVSGIEYVGGLVGGIWEGATVSNSFWDVETSGLTTSAAGVGKTTVEMKTELTFTDAGWDFENVWWIDSTGIQNDGYPELRAIHPAPLFAGGSGTELDPYQITNAIQLQMMKDNLNAHYTLMNDIDASETINWDTGAGFEPIGDHITPFTGTFQGNGYVIKNLYINRPEAKGVGLFGRVAPDAVVENVGLESVNITGWDWTGGLVGVNKGTVSNSYTTGSISGLGFITGGLVAANTPGGIVSKSYSTASVSGVSMIGGLVGYNRGTITYSYSRGSVAGGSTAGGLVGFNLFEGIISDSYSRASVSGKYNIGGLVGYIAFEAIVSNSYSTGQVSGIEYVGGLVGGIWEGATVSNSFWDVETSGLTTSAAGVGKTTVEMKTELTFTDAGWDFENVWWIDSTGIQNDGYPELRAIHPPVINTPVGENVVVVANENVTLVFENVRVAGNTVVEMVEGTPPANFRLIPENIFYDIKTTAEYTGWITLAISYSDVGLTPEEENDLRLMQWDNVENVWVDITTWVDTENNVIYGQTTHLSLFAVMLPIDLTPPISYVSTIEPYWQNATTIPFEVTVTASDDISGVDRVELYYRFSLDNEMWDNWKFYGTDETEPWSWQFDPPEGDGYYDFYSIAADVAGNVEEPPAEPDARCAVDTVDPVSEVNPLDYWQLSLPFEITASAEDPVPPSGAMPSGLLQVELWYRHSWDNERWSKWALFGADVEFPYSWSFDTPAGYGFYEVYTIARDVASNVEIAPDRADQNFCVVIPAEIDIDPDTLNLKSQGRWITYYIELPLGYAPENILVSTIALEGQDLFETLLLAEPWPTEIGDYDNDGIPDLMVKFDRSDVQSLVQVSDNVELTVFGLWCRIPFRDSDNIRVIDPGKAPKRLNQVREKWTPPGLDEDFVPPGRGGTPPGHERRGFTPSGQGGTPPSQEKRDTTLPGEEDTPPGGQEKRDRTPPGQSDEASGRGRGRGRSKP
jgi:hypothetical protein